MAGELAKVYAALAEGKAYKITGANFVVNTRALSHGGLSVAMGPYTIMYGEEMDRKAAAALGGLVSTITGEARLLDDDVGLAASQVDAAGDIVQVRAAHNTCLIISPLMAD